MSSRQPAGEDGSTVVAPGNSRTVKEVVRETAQTKVLASLDRMPVRTEN
jgi:hypothetical protein